MASTSDLIRPTAFTVLTGPGRRLHPACIAGALLTLVIQLCAVTRLQSAAWKAVAQHLIGRWARRALAMDRQSGHSLPSGR